MACAQKLNGKGADILSTRESVLTVVEYRKLLNDHESTAEQIIQRLEYIESFCRSVIRAELKNYAKQSKR